MKIHIIHKFKFRLLSFTFFKKLSIYLWIFINDKCKDIKNLFSDPFKNSYFVITSLERRYKYILLDINQTVKYPFSIVF